MGMRTVHRCAWDSATHFCDFKEAIRVQKFDRDGLEQLKDNVTPQAQWGAGHGKAAVTCRLLVRNSGKAAPTRTRITIPNSVFVPVELQASVADIESLPKGVIVNADQNRDDDSEFSREAFEAPRPDGSDGA